MKPTVVSLFTGAGGLDWGLEAAGFNTIAAVECDDDAVRTLRGTKLRNVARKADVTKPDEVGQLVPDGVDLDLLVGGPPCQPFSKAAYWASGDSPRLSDPRAATLEHYLRILEETRPKAFLFENVAALGYAGKREALDFLLARIASIGGDGRGGYTTQFEVLNSADYGVPQLRERFFIVGSRAGISFDFPPATHGPTQKDGQLPLGLARYTTAWDALGDLPNPDDPALQPRGHWGALLPSIPEGQNYQFHTDRGEGAALFGWRTKYWSFLLKLAKNRPSWTIQAKPGPAIGPFHWKSRRLSMRELCRLQTFPDGITVTGSLSAIQRQLGNAVPSLLAEVLGREIRRQLLGHRIRHSKLKLLPEHKVAPAAEPCRSVPREYHKLIGEHAPHPGTGRGPRALALWPDAAE